MDQAQSLNLYIEDYTHREFTKLMFMGFDLLLKTGKYYLHTRPKSMPQKFTIDPDKALEIMKKINESESNRNNTIEKVEVICDLCGA